jgi:hypothetical protein
MTHVEKCVTISLPSATANETVSAMDSAGELFVAPTRASPTAPRRCSTV